MIRRLPKLDEADIVASQMPRRRKGAGDPPLYEVVDSLIRRRLVDNVWRPGDVIPSEIQLAQEFGVSQGTVRKAIDALVTEGVLTRRQGLGTFVSEMRDRRELFLFFNLVAEDGHREMPAAKVLSCRRSRASALETQKLELEKSATVVRLHRLRLFKGVPRIVELSVLADKQFPNFGRDGDIPDHLFRHYETSYGVTVVRATEKLRAVAANEEDAELLGIDLGAPLLQIDRVAVSLQGRPVEWRISRCDTADFDYLVERG